MLEQLKSRKLLPSLDAAGRGGRRGEGGLIGIKFRLFANPGKLDQITAPSIFQSFRISKALSLL